MAEEYTLEQEFINAIIDQNIDLAKELLLYDININYRNLYGQTLLILSVNFDLIEIVALLLDNGADINLFDNDRESALTRASFLGRRTIVELLVNYGADINHRTSSGASSLILSGFNNDVDLIKILISGGANINDVDEKKTTTLMVAAAWNNFEVCTFLVSNGADLIATDIDETTALVDYGINANDYDGLSNKLRESNIETLKIIWIQRIKNERWIRRGPIICVLAENAYRPLKARALTIALAAKNNFSKTIIVNTSRVKEVLCDFGLSRYIIEFL
jgi:ankyrin repeat protein